MPLQVIIVVLNILFWNQGQDIHLPAAQQNRLNFRILNVFPRQRIRMINFDVVIGYDHRLLPPQVFIDPQSRCDDKQSPQDSAAKADRQYQGQYCRNKASIPFWKMITVSFYFPM